eukprot:SAG31_NODE_21521_length_547_cov_1.042411_2_plen_33_part_01
MISELYFDRELGLSRWSPLEAIVTVVMFPRPEP